MPISVERASRHVSEWTQKLERYQSRKGWANSLFHACQIEVIPSIFHQGVVLPRASVGELICDVANQGALWNNPRAHNYVRLYFRPKNKFHLKTEGIKSDADPYRQTPHMSVPVMLVFDFQSVITSQATSFVSGNFAATGAEPSDGDEAFDLLDFSKIYHDSPHNDPLIHEARMSEVVVDERLSLEHLKAVFCRTIYEARTLRHLIGEREGYPRIIVEQGRNLFFHRAIYLDEVYRRDGVLSFKFHPPSTGIKEKYDVVVRCEAMEFRYQLSAGSWRIPALVNYDPEAVWEILIEGCLAYKAKIPYSDVNIV